MIDNIRKPVTEKPLQEHIAQPDKKMVVQPRSPAREPLPKHK
jgi:hypothetical protein